MLLLVMVMQQQRAVTKPQIALTLMEAMSTNASQPVEYHRLQYLTELTAIQEPGREAMPEARSALQYQVPTGSE